MLETIHEHGTQLCATEVARSAAELSLRPAEPQPQIICASESSLLEQVGKIKSYNTRLDVQCWLKAQAGRGGLTRHLLVRASESIRSLRETSGRSGLTMMKNVLTLGIGAMVSDPAGHL